MIIRIGISFSENNGVAVRVSKDSTQIKICVVMVVNKTTIQPDRQESFIDRVRQSLHISWDIVEIDRIGQSEVINAITHNDLNRSIATKPRPRSRQNRNDTTDDRITGIVVNGNTTGF